MAPMGKVRLAALSLLATVAVALLSAQHTPDFSGTWVLESGPTGEPDAPQTISVSQVLATTNVRGEPMRPFFKEVRITRVIANSTRSQTYQIGVVGGSTSGRVGGAEGPRTQYRAVWEGQSLVFELGTYAGSSPRTGDWTGRREVWSFDSAGRLRVVVNTRSSLDEPKTVVIVYRKS